MTPPAPPNDLRLQGLLVENVKRVKLVQIKPRAAAGVVEVAGANGSGKSSTLDALMYALGGGATMPPKPLRAGATKGKAEVVLSTKDGTPVLKITRSFTPTDSTLAVERIGAGGKISKPQEFLDALAGAGLGFDPLAFMRLKPKAQVEELLRLAQLEADPRALDGERQKYFEERTAANRDARRLEAQLAGMPEPAVEVPDEEISVEKLLAEQRLLITQRETRTSGESAVHGLRHTRATWLAEVERCRQELALAEERLAVASTALTAAEATLATMPVVDLSDIERQLASAETTNAAIRRKLQRRDVTEELVTKQHEAQALTRKITQVDERKTEILAAAKFPVPGLSFQLVGNDYAVTFNGQPLEQVSQSEQIKVCMAVAIARNPGIRVVLIRDGSLLDAESRALVDTMATEDGYHVLMEVVGDGDPGAFIIEDGGLREVEPAAKVAW